VGHAAREPQKSGDWFGGLCAEAIVLFFEVAMLNWRADGGDPCLGLRLAISALVLAMNLLGDGLRDALDPCLRWPLAVLGELPEGPRPHLCSSH
jgi:hypothetical protein